jgi:hypothetical protein
MNSEPGSLSHLLTLAVQRRRGPGSATAFPDPDEFARARWRVRIRLPGRVSHSATVDIRLGHCNGETEGLSDVDSSRHDPGRTDDRGDGHQNVLHVFQGHP